MTTNQFSEAEKIMTEIREIESFLKVFGEGHRTSIIAYEKAATSLDRDRERSFPMYVDSYLHHVIMDSMRERIKVLNNMLEKI